MGSTHSCMLNLIYRGLGMRSHHLRTTEVSHLFRVNSRHILHWHWMYNLCWKWMNEHNLFAYWVGSKHSTRGLSKNYIISHSFQMKQAMLSQHVTSLCIFLKSKSGSIMVLCSRDLQTSFQCRDEEQSKQWPILGPRPWCFSVRCDKFRWALFCWKLWDPLHVCRYWPDRPLILEFLFYSADTSVWRVKASTRTSGL